MHNYLRFPYYYPMCQQVNIGILKNKRSIEKNMFSSRKDGKSTGMK